MTSGILQLILYCFKYLTVLNPISVSMQVKKPQMFLRIAAIIDGSYRVKICKFL